MGWQLQKGFFMNSWEAQDLWENLVSDAEIPKALRFNGTGYCTNGLQLLSRFASF